MLKGLIGRLTAVLVATVVVASALSLLRPLPLTPSTRALPKVVPAGSVSLPWPAYGQAALGAQGFGLLASNGSQQPAPIASIAKVITALAVLKQKPLGINDQGPTITLGSADVNDYNNYVSQDGSVVPVVVGEQISERQALEAMLLPSANNMAYSLAAWAFGSLNSYTAFANQFVKTLGMAQTTVADASGFAPATVSTATDLTKLALAAMYNPVLTQIVSQKQATVPIAGNVQNINWLLGRDGIVGIKTGNTDQAGGCFLFAAQRTIKGQPVTIVGTVINAPDLATSMRDSRALVVASDQNFEQLTIADSHQTIGTFRARWGSGSSAIAQRGLSLLRWRSQSVAITSELQPIKVGLPAGTPIGVLRASAGQRSVSVPAVSGPSLADPSFSWRLMHL